jgi:hypothetical protein
MVFCQVVISQQQTGQEAVVSILPTLEGGGAEARGLLTDIAYVLAGQPRRVLFYVFLCVF